MPLTIEFQYINHRGETRIRTVDVDSVEFHHAPGYGYQPGWFVSGYDHDKNNRRSFALNRIVFPDHGEGNKVFKLINMKGN